MSDLITLSLTTVSAPDAIALARFYAEITGGDAKGDEHWALVEGPNGDIGFQQADDHRAPTWPEGEVGMQLHLEFFVDDLHWRDGGNPRLGRDPGAAGEGVRDTCVRVPG